MGTLERVLGAETSSDLKQQEYWCDVDVLKAVGMAGVKHPLHLAVFRAKYLGDQESVVEAREQFFQWTCAAMHKRGRDLRGSREMADKALVHWLGEVCPKCNGTKFIKEKNAPVLSAKLCATCRGTGKRVIPGGNEVVKDVIERADGLVYKIERRISRRMK